MKLRLVSVNDDLGAFFKKELEGHGHEVEVEERAVDALRLLHAPDVSWEALGNLIEQIQPLTPLVEESLEEGDEVVLELGDHQPLDTWNLKCKSPKPLFASELREEFAGLGFSASHEEESIERDELVYGGATEFARQVVRYVLAKHGITPKENKSWGESDNDLYVRFDAPFVPHEKGQVPIELRGDDYAEIRVLRDRLQERGFENITMRLGVTDEEYVAFRQEESSRLEAGYADELAAEIEGFLAERGIDLVSYPLLREPTEQGETKLTVPFRCISNGDVRPYAGDDPRRWNIEIATDAPERAEELFEGLRALGLEPWPAQKPPTKEYRCTMAYTNELPASIREQLVETAQAFLAGQGIEKLYLREIELEGHVELMLPLNEEDEEQKRKEAIEAHNLQLYRPEPTSYEALTEELRGWSFGSFSLNSSEPNQEPEIQYGGAPISLVEELVERFEQEYGVEGFKRNKCWSDDDKDIRIHLPAEGSAPKPARASAAKDLDTTAWFAPASSEDAVAPLLEIGTKHVRVGPLRLPRREEIPGAPVPPVEKFRHYCLDQRTTETLLHVAESVLLREPCLLEGETGVSKTSIVEYLAMLLNQPLIRLNLNGQTDTGELIGRFLPQSVTEELPLDPNELLKSADLLEPESRLILDRARRDERTLNNVEIQQLMANERMHTHPWRWVDGLVLQAMREGWWLLLDELNLAEPQILERLNSVLERSPSIVVTENDNQILGPGGEPVHPSFRIFGTMNPAEYAGRSPLSPAYRDRWRGYRYVELPKEREYQQMLTCLVHGTQPNVALRGRRYSGGLAPPAFGMLTEIPKIDAFLDALSRFHAALEESVNTEQGRRKTQLGGRRKERYVFSRRSLLSVMGYLASAVAADDEHDPVYAMRLALSRYYLGRVTTAEDRLILGRLLDAAGIGLQTWELG